MNSCCLCTVVIFHHFPEGPEQYPLCQPCPGLRISRSLSPGCQAMLPPSSPVGSQSYPSSLSSCPIAQPKSSSGKSFSEVHVASRPALPKAGTTPHNPHSLTAFKYSCVLTVPDSGELADCCQLGLVLFFDFYI